MVTARPTSTFCLGARGHGFAEARDQHRIDVCRPGCEHFLGQGQGGVFAIDGLCCIATVKTPKTAEPLVNTKALPELPRTSCITRTAPRSPKG